MRLSGILTPTATSPPQSFSEPLSIEEMQQFLRLPIYSPADAESELLLDAMIRAARSLAETERYQGRDIAGRQWDLTLDTFPPGGEIELRRELESVDLFTYKDSGGTTRALVENTDYFVDTVRGLVTTLPSGTWPAAMLWPTSAILIRHTTKDYIEEEVRHGLKLLVAQWYEGRLPFDAQANISHSAANAQAPTTLPFAVELLLKMGGVKKVY